MTDPRKANFDQAIEDYDPKALGKCVDFAKHRFVSVERDAHDVNRYVKGHETLRAACAYLSDATEGGEPYVPEFVLDLDTGRQYELELFAFVAPKDVDPVAVMLPREALDFALAALNHIERDSVQAGRLWKAASVAFERALERRSP